MKWTTKENARLVQAVLALETAKEAELFLRDLMTEKEICEFANRLKAAKMLLEKIPYTVIEQETGLSSTTVARVAKWLGGKGGGYKIILQKIHHHNPTQLRRGLS